MLCLSSLLRNGVIVFAVMIPKKTLRDTPL